ncbi:alpha/beta hydrolase [Caenispirillum bisanense]|uniref:alpha/beta hydrolase n=1 Tax=Caenispirillum bisanense TaxID=414052 RepID=UPI0031E00200
MGEAVAPLCGALQRGPFSLSFGVEGQGVPTLVIGSAVYYPRTFSADLRRHLRLAFVDHRGYGGTTGGYGADDITLDRVIEDMEALRRHLDLDERVVVLGHSGHGYMALEYAKRYPQHVAGVVMVGTGPSHGAADMALAERAWAEAVCPERKARYDADMSGLADAIAADPDNRFVTFCLRMAARSWFDPAFDAAPLWQGVTVNLPVIDHLWGETFRDIDITAGLPDLDRPVLLAMGRFDHLVAPVEAWAPRRPLFRDLTVRVFERSGHTPQLEEPAAFDAVLLQWLAAKGLA